MDIQQRTYLSVDSFSAKIYCGFCGQRWIKNFHWDHDMQRFNAKDHCIQEIRKRD